MVGRWFGLAPRGEALCHLGGMNAIVVCTRLSELLDEALSWVHWTGVDAVMAATPEAVFVSMIDNLDARMGIVQRALRNAPEDEEFTERLLGLESPLLLKRLPD